MKVQFCSTMHVLRELDFNERCIQVELVRLYFIMQISGICTYGFFRHFLIDFH
jgi:hypothetical protein